MDVLDVVDDVLDENSTLVVNRCMHSLHTTPPCDPCRFGWSGVLCDRSWFHEFGIGWDIYSSGAILIYSTCLVLTVVSIRIAWVQSAHASKLSYQMVSLLSLGASLLAQLATTTWSLVTREMYTPVPLSLFNVAQCLFFYCLSLILCFWLQTCGSSLPRNLLGKIASVYTVFYIAVALVGSILYGFSELDHTVPNVMGQYMYYGAHIVSGLAVMLGALYTLFRLFRTFETGGMVVFRAMSFCLLLMLVYYGFQLVVVVILPHFYDQAWPWFWCTVTFVLLEGALILSVLHLLLPSKSLRTGRAMTACVSVSEAEVPFLASVRRLDIPAGPDDTTPAAGSPGVVIGGGSSWSTVG